MNQSLLNYFKKHSNTYSIDILKGEALKAGNSQSDIDEICNFLNLNSRTNLITQNSDSDYILIFYILPMITLVLFSVIFVYLNLNQKIFSLYLNITLSIIILLSYFMLYKKYMDKSKLILYSIFSFILVPLLGSVLQEGLNIYRFILEFSNAPDIFAIEIFKKLSVSMLLVLSFYSIILGLFSYKYIFKTYLSKRSKLFSIFIGIVIFLFVFITLIYIKEMFNILIITYFGNLLI